MNLNFSIYTSLLVSCLFSIASIHSQALAIKNSNLEGVNKKTGTFYWWANQAKETGRATFSIETTDVNKGSTKALKVTVGKVGEKPWFVSTAFSNAFPVKQGEGYTVTFFAKRGPKGTGKLGLVFQSDVKGSFQNKQFRLSEEWQPYSHMFMVPNTSDKNQIKFWYLEEGTTYFIDDVTVLKE